MNAIEKIKEKLANYPELKYRLEEGCIKVRPANNSGFEIMFYDNGPNFTIFFDGWHEHFDEEDEALEAFAFGLSDQCRLKVIKYGSKDYKWIVQSKIKDEWKEDSMTGLLFIPFWKKKTIEYRQNKII